MSKSRSDLFFKNPRLLDSLTKGARSPSSFSRRRNIIPHVVADASALRSFSGFDVCDLSQSVPDGFWETLPDFSLAREVKRVAAEVDLESTVKRGDTGKRRKPVPPHHPKYLFGQPGANVVRNRDLFSVADLRALFVARDFCLSSGLDFPKPFARDSRLFSKAELFLPSDQLELNRLIFVYERRLCWYYLRGVPADLSQFDFSTDFFAAYVPLGC